MNACKHSIYLTETPATLQQTSCCGRFIVSHLYRGFNVCSTIVFTSGGLICCVVISCVLVWIRDVRKRTSPEERIPAAICHFSHRGSKSSPKARVMTQSQDTTQLVNYSLVSLTSWPIEPWLNKWPAKWFKNIVKKSSLRHLLPTEICSIGCWLYFPFFYFLTANMTFGLCNVLKLNDRRAKLTVMMQPLNDPISKKAFDFIGNNEWATLIATTVPDGDRRVKKG